MLATCRNGGVSLTIAHERGEEGGDHSWEKGPRMTKSWSTMGAAGAATVRVTKETTLLLCKKKS
jgi:hypothetical protein